MSLQNSMRAVARDATRRWLSTLASRAAFSPRVSLVSPVATWTSSASTGATGEDVDGATEEGQERALMHYCAGVRRILSQREDASALSRDREDIVAGCDELKRTLPVTYKSGAFMSAAALQTAFGFELERARSADDLAAITNVVVRCAERGLVPYHNAREMYARVRDVLTRHGATAAAETLEAFAGERIGKGDPTEVHDVTPWTVTRNNPSLDAKLVQAAMDVQKSGYAVVDDVFGDATARAVRDALETFVETNFADGHVFKKGELDYSDRHVLSAEQVDEIRDDTISWLSGDEDGLVGAFAQTLRTTMLFPLHLALSEGGSQSVLAPVDSYVSNAMLSVYEPGARGFVPHVDNCGPDVDKRALTAVYYPRGSESREGGALTLFPGDGDREIHLFPKRDRLVLFASARVPHAVESRARDAVGRRVAASFWYLGDPRAVGPRESDAS